MSISHLTDNADPKEVDKFERIAASWWDPDGAFKPLHQINPLRVQYIRRRVALSGRQVLDIGCGGGLLCEALAREGASVTGIDAGARAVAVANLHLHESGLDIRYRQQAAEKLAKTSSPRYDIVTCMELLEHAANPTVVVAACAKLVKTDGHVFFSTINRTLKSFAGAIIAAEYILKLLPKGTHDYHRFIRPSELSDTARKVGLHVQDYAGIGYNPLLRSYRITPDVSINYLAHFVKQK